MTAYYWIEKNLSSDKNQLPHQILILEQLKMNIDEKQPDAVHWLSTYLWNMQLIREWCYHQYQRFPDISLSNKIKADRANKLLKLSV